MTSTAPPASGPSYRAGDLLRISCPFTETTVTRLARFYISVHWPWNRVDPGAERIRWNGSRAIAIDPASFDAVNDLFTLEPDSSALVDGAACRVGIVPTVVHVVDVTHFDPPQITGWLPRPRTLVTVLKAGQSQEPGFDDQGLSIDPYGEVPFKIDVLVRPYDFLEIGDKVSDADSRTWTFLGPWDWQPFDAEPGIAPAWPLTLLHRTGISDGGVAATVAEATTTGSHAAVLGRWRQLTGADPVAARTPTRSPQEDRSA